MMTDSLDMTHENNSTVRVVIVDDRLEVRESMEILLSLQDNIEVVGLAEDGEEAVEVARNLNPDVILMDVVMPSRKSSKPFDGLDACRQIKREGLSAAVIALTVHADHTTRYRAQQAGCSLFLEKGVSGGELVHQVLCLGLGSQHPQI